MAHTHKGIRCCTVGDYNAAHKIIMPHVAHTHTHTMMPQLPHSAIRIASVSRLAWRSLSAAAAATSRCRRYSSVCTTQNERAKGHKEAPAAGHKCCVTAQQQ